MESKKVLRILNDTQESLKIPRISKNSFKILRILNNLMNTISKKPEVLKKYQKYQMNPRISKNPKDIHIISSNL